VSALFHPLRVRAIEPDTDEAVIVCFDVPPELRGCSASTRAST
jgi:ring-1,2-phenylacetyl-CoA epoxidase subunit PaaE